MSSCHTATASAAATATASAARPDPTYPLQRDAAEHARLEAQARFWSPDAAALFDAAGVASGARVVDLGSGTLHVASLLAARVGPAGSVHALDSDSLLVRRLAHEARSAGVRLLEGDAYATGWPRGCLDVAHARFLAAPAGRLDALVTEMRRLVRAGGTVILQEPDGDSWDVADAGYAWKRLRELIRAGFALRGGCFDAGRALSRALATAGLVNVLVRTVSKTLPATHPYAALPLAFARQLRPLWLESGLTAPDELDDLLEAVKSALARGGEARTFTLVQAWAQVPG